MERGEGREEYRTLNDVRPMIGEYCLCSAFFLFGKTFSGNRLSEFKMYRNN